MRSTKKIISFLLVLVFLSINFAVELTHHHTVQSQDPTLTQTGNPSADGVSPESHNLGCIACFFSVTYVAPTAKYFTFNPESGSYPASFREFIFYSVTLPTSNHLRAPPQTA